MIGSTGYYLVRSDEDGIGHNVSFSIVPGAGRVFMRATSATSGNLRLIRRGTQLSSYLDGELFYQVTCATNAMTCQLMLLNNTTPDAIAATFDNVKISATRLQPRWNSFSTYVFAKGLDGADADPSADPDGDGASNLMEYGAGTDPASSNSTPPAFVLGTVVEAPGGPYFTFTTRLAKPIPSDLDVGAEFSMDLGLLADWMSTGIGVTDTDQGDHIERTFRAPFIIGYPPAGFMRLKLSQH